MKKILSSVIGVTTALMLAGCSYNPVENALITGKTNSVEFTHTIIIGRIQIPQYQPVYRVEVEYDGVVKTWRVGPTVYNSCRVGERVDRDEKGNIHCYP